MAQQLVTVGNVAGDGTGDQLRDAFTKINENFTELYSGNVQVAAANIQVYTVAGRTGNVTLTVNDVTQAAAKSYVNTSIASNISAVNSNIASLRANITAANSNISDHSARITTLEANAATQSLAISNLSSTKATISYVDDSISLALSSNAILLNVDTINANVTAANAKIASLETNAAAQSIAINTVNANIAAANLALLNKASLSGATFTGNVQATYLLASNHIETDEFLKVGPSNDLGQPFANPAALFYGNASDYYQLNLQNIASTGSGDLVVTADDGADGEHFIAMGINNTGWADPNYPMGSPGDGYLWITGGNLQLVSREDNIELLVGNISTPQVVLTQSNILKLSSGVTLQFGDGSSQTSAFNSASYTSTINSIDANIGLIATNLATLNSNAASQASVLITLTANAVTQAQSLDILLSNAATQETTVNNLSANLGTATINITALQSNAGSQAVSINSLNANIGSYQTFANANAAAQAATLNTLSSNAVIQAQAIDNLISNAATQGASLNILSANIGAYQTWANIQIPNLPLFSANLGAYQIYANAINATTQANLGAYQLYANANAAVQEIAINTINANIIAMNLAIASGPNLQAVSSNVLPSANVTYSLGSQSRQWKDLWVSSNTIYIGGAALTIQSGNLLVNGNQINYSTPAFDFGTFGSPINYTLDLGTF